VNTTGTQFTVPAGKAWKITSFGGHTGRFSCTQFATMYMKIGSAYATNRIDGGSIWSGTCSASCGGSTLFGATNEATFWVSENTVVELGWLSSYNTTCSSVYMTGIEFNIEPE